MRAALCTVSLSICLAFAIVAVAQTSSEKSEQSNATPPATKQTEAPKSTKDAKGNPIRVAKNTGHVSNYDEDKIPPYKLPDPLVMQDGRPVTSAEMWQKERRPEILKFYETQFYGRVPENAPKVKWEVTETDPKARDGEATMKKVVGRIGDGNTETDPKINLTEYIPNNATGPVPMMLSISFNFGAGAKKGPPADDKKGPPPGDPIAAEFLSHGWGYARIIYNDIQPDALNRQTEGVLGLTLKEGETKPAPDMWGGISAWAWGISRTIDYLETDKAVNARQICITGTSRLGKTVLWAGAQDPRVAAVCSIVSGEMGAALIRRDWGETLDDMAQNFPWQFAGNLQNWSGKWNDLPVDQHMLIALTAPRPVYVNGGINDQWSDPKGEFLSVVAAGPVYKLLGGQDLGVTEVPELDHPITTGDLGFHYHSQGHQAVPADWKAFREFAERHFAAAKDK
jgi:hypothetical protein